MMLLTFVRQSVLIQYVCQQYRQLDQAQQINEALSNYWRQRFKNVQKLELEACVRNAFFSLGIWAEGNGGGLCIVSICCDGCFASASTWMVGWISRAPLAPNLDRRQPLSERSLGRTFMEKMV
jgi:hypothetical protein